jgi:excisionase family DNA binding protein
MSNETQTAYAPLMTVDEAAEFLRVSRRQVYNLLQAGAIPSVRVGTRARFDRNELVSALRSADERGATP